MLQVSQMRRNLLLGQDSMLSSAPHWTIHEIYNTLPSSCNPSGSFPMVLCRIEFSNHQRQ